MRRFLFSTSLLCISVFQFCSIGFAQDSTEVPLMEGVLPPISIESARVQSITTQDAPFAISVLNRSVERQNLEPGLSLEEILNELPGIWVNDRGNGSIGERISIRGMGARSQFGVRGVQVVLDGVPLTMPDGQAFADIVSPSMIKRAEVIRGPSSLFWGNGSGGVVFLSTRSQGEAPKVRLRAVGGGYDSFESPGSFHQLSAEAKGRINASQLSVFVSNDQRGGYRDYSASRFTRAALHGTVPVGTTSVLQFTGAIADQDSENPGQRNAEDLAENPRGAFSRNVDQRAGKQSFQAQISTSLLTSTNWGQLTTSIYGIVRDLDNPLGVPYSFAVPPPDRVYRYIDLNRLAGGFRVDLQDQTPELQWGVGIDLGLQDDDRRNVDNILGSPGNDVRLDQQETVSNFSAFGFLNYRLAGPFSLHAGLRSDRVHFSMTDRFFSPNDPTAATFGDQSGSRTFNAVSPALGFSVELDNAIVYSNYRKAFETPTTTELVNRPDTDGGFNPNVDPQTVDGFELGIRGTLNTLSTHFDVALYRMNVKDRLSSDETPEGRAFFFNAGETSQNGIELSLQTRFNHWLSAQLLHNSNQFEYTKGDFDGNVLPGIPDHRTQVLVRARMDRLWIQMGIRNASSYFVDDENTEKNDAYTVVDFNLGGAGLPMKTTTLYPFVRISNIFDTLYSGSIVVNAAGGRYYEPSPGRNFQVGFNLHI
ncbi:MAG: TonB-dependent receptor plug domain-containing protein [Rhodothermaceae bacterium]|nr:TonB-dependent receptor plug domain-containing protein [Rhodothermaceae bacterium]